MGQARASWRRRCHLPGFHAAGAGTTPARQRQNPVWRTAQPCSRGCLYVQRRAGRAIDRSAPPGNSCPVAPGHYCPAPQSGAHRGVGGSSGFIRKPWRKHFPSPRAGQKRGEQPVHDEPAESRFARLRSRSHHSDSRDSTVQSAPAARATSATASTSASGSAAAIARSHVASAAKSRHTSGGTGSRRSDARARSSGQSASWWPLPSRARRSRRRPAGSECSDLRPTSCQHTGNLTRLASLAEGRPGCACSGSDGNGGLLHRSRCGRCELA